MHKGQSGFVSKKLLFFGKVTPSGLNDNSSHIFPRVAALLNLTTWPPLKGGLDRSGLKKINL